MSGSVMLSHSSSWRTRLLFDGVKSFAQALARFSFALSSQNEWNAPMPQNDSTLTREHLKTPKAAAVAGILFSILLAVMFWLFRSSVPADPLERGEWIATNTATAALGLNLVPFAGIAFLWFIGVLRDRLGSMEDRFFATVFFGSALLFLAMLFIAAAMIGALILIAATTQPDEMINSAAFKLARAAAYIIANVYAIKMAGVFMISTSTVIIYTRIVPPWIAAVGYVLAFLLLVGSYYLSWSFIVLPVWIVLISIYILIDNLRPRDRVALWSGGD
jgi:hypothetical protein